MHFYGMTYREVLDMPVRLFWFLTEQVKRIRAEALIAAFPLHTVAMGGEHVQDVLDDLRGQYGTPLIVDQLTMSERDIAKAKALFGGG